MPASKRTRPGVKRPVKGFERRFETEYIKNGGNGSKAMEKLRPDLTHRSAQQLAYAVLQRPEVRARIQDRIEQATGVTPAEVIGTLANNMRMDLTDIMRDDGTPDLQRAKELGMGNLIRRVVYGEESIEVTGNGSKKKEPETIIRRQVISVEFHNQLVNQREAAAKLADMMGIEDQAKDAAQKAMIRVRIERWITEYANRRFNGNIAIAREHYLKACPDLAPYVATNGTGKV